MRAVGKKIQALRLDDIYVTFVISLDVYILFCVGSEPLRLGVELGLCFEIIIVKIILRGCCDGL